MAADELSSRRPDPYRWQDDAESTAPAKALCDGCPVRLECLEAGLSERFGMWGGRSERARRRLRQAGLRRTLPERKCKLCGATFRPTVPQQIYCCPECTSTAAHRAHRARKREAERQAS